tara:strand:- start:1732 stop:2139 length:408 start_codon:yes stop_codon:yes gene_type:complete
LVVRIHRNLNDRTADQSEGWVITENGKTRRVRDLVLRLDSVKVSAPTLERIRTPKNEKTSSGASGLGRRTVGAWLVGSICTFSMGDNLTPTGARIAFNPKFNDTFQVKRGAAEGPLECRGQFLRFHASGLVEVVA